MKVKVNRAKLDGLNPEQRREAEKLLEELNTLREENPLAFFEPHPANAQGRRPQKEFLEAKTAVIAAFCGNQFGKTTILTIRALCECLSSDMLPRQLAGYKNYDPPVFGWIVCPSEDKVFDSLIPAFRDWAPKQAFTRGIDKAWNGQRMQLTFANGSQITFKTYKQDPSTLGGARLHFVGYDEPPPREHRDECATRLVRYGGYEMYAMTPLKANTGWIKRDIYKNRESPDVTVVRGSMHENQTLDSETVKRTLASYASDIWRRAREDGDFVDVGGLIYPDFERCVVDPDPVELVRSWDPVVSIDPGIRNCGIIFGGFDDENVCTFFDELLLQDETPADYAVGIRRVLQRWGIPEGKVMFVIDPAARSRSQVNAESVESELGRHGIYCVHGQNQVEAGIQQMRVRMQSRRLRVFSTLRGLRDEADEYAAEDRDDGEFRVVKQNDHRLDAARYLVMARPWYPVVEEDAPHRQLGFQPNRALPASVLHPQQPVGPLGSMS